jgi:hypothetical protein
VVEPAHQCRGGALFVIIRATKCHDITRITSD